MSNSIITANNLDALRDALNEATEEEIWAVDMTSLPTFGGTEPHDTEGVWSWDESRLLVSDNKRGEGFAIVSRSDF